MSRSFGVATLLYSTDYLPGVFTLGYQLKRLIENKEAFKTCLIVTKPLYQNDLSDLSKKILGELFDEVVQVDPLKDQDLCMEQNAPNLTLLQRPELAFTFIKARLWELTQFDRVLYLDGDTLPLDEDFIKIFDVIPDQRSSQVVGSPDIGWPDMFNSGVLMLVPDMEMAARLQLFLLQHISMDGADQGILNQFFNPCCFMGTLNGLETNTNEWIRLPFIYNVTMPNYGYQSSPAIKYFESQIKLVHFIGENKPWKGWSQPNVNGYTTLWYKINKAFQEEYQLTKCFEELSIEEKPKQKLWDPTAYYQQKIGDRNSVGVDTTDSDSDGNNAQLSVKEELPERVFSEDTRTQTILSEKTAGFRSNGINIFGPYSQPERVFPVEPSAAAPVKTTENVDNHIVPSLTPAYAQYETNPERVFPQDKSTTPHSAHESENHGRVFPEDTRDTDVAQGSSTNESESLMQARSSNPHGAAFNEQYVNGMVKCVEDAESMLRERSPPRDSPIERTLASIREEPREESWPPHIFDWEDTDYLTKVERAFPDNA